MKENDPIRERYVKMNFLKRIWYSMTKFEKYPEMAALGTKKAIIYFTEMMLIFSIIVTMIYIYYVSNIVEFKEENLSLSEKVVNQIIDIYKDEQIAESMKTLIEYSDITVIVTMFISVFISFYVTTTIDVFTLSIFGLFTCFIAKIKINYKSIFSMSIFALTLSIVLKIIYIGLNFLIGFEIKNFDIMYISIAYICLAAAIFMIKVDVIKQQMELMKIIEDGKEKIEQTIIIPKKHKEDEEEKKENKSNEENTGEQDENDTEGQGSNA